MSHARDRLTGHIETSLQQALTSLTSAEFVVSGKPKTGEAVREKGELEEPFVWQQSFSIVEGPALWIAAGKEVWEAMGRLTLEAAGIDAITDEDCRSTWQEVVAQTIAGVAAGVTADVLREVSAAGGQELSDPPEADWIAFYIRQGGGSQGEEKTWTIRIAWSPKLAGLYDPQPQEATKPAGRDSTMSKTFDLLLEVALPVSVSFGKTSLQIREVLKLNTGSIVELNRFVNDPVEVIVNDCVIARGEVVVVDGNYGVRISQLASREDRLRTGMAETHRIGVRP
jgi:flagellar motor switch protein FliN/FliY